MSTIQATYYKHEYANLVVRHHQGGWDTYRKGRGWVYDPDKCGILLGVHMDYEEISEQEAIQTIRRLEQPAS